MPLSYVRYGWQAIPDEMDYPRTPQDRSYRMPVADRTVFDKDAELSHVGELCSFDAFLLKYSLTDPALQQLAVIVRGADTSKLDLTPQSAGLYAVSLGL